MLFTLMLFRNLKSLVSSEILVSCNFLPFSALVLLPVHSATPCPMLRITSRPPQQLPLFISRSPLDLCRDLQDTGNFSQFSPPSRSVSCGREVYVSASNVNPRSYLSLFRCKERWFSLAFFTSFHFFCKVQLLGAVQPSLMHCANAYVHTGVSIKSICLLGSKAQ
jgi:hypothetical protein